MLDTQQCTVLRRMYEWQVEQAQTVLTECSGECEDWQYRLAQWVLSHRQYDLWQLDNGKLDTLLDTQTATVTGALGSDFEVM